MKPISIKTYRYLNYGSIVDCADNTGAKQVKIISAFGQKTRKSQIPNAGVADLVNVVVKKGRPDVRGKIFRAVIVRTKKGFRRSNGVWVKFESNAVVIVDKEGLPKGSEVKGPIPREIGERYPKLVGAASIVI